MENNETNNFKAFFHDWNKAVMPGDFKAATVSKVAARKADPKVCYY